MKLFFVMAIVLVLVGIIRLEYVVVDLQERLGSLELPRFPRAFPCRVLLRNDRSRRCRFRIRDCHPLWWPVPGTFFYLIA